MKNFGRFGPLIGVIQVTNSDCKFLVYASQNAEILTCHEIKLNIINKGEPEWVEFDPHEIWRSVVDCVERGVQNLIYLDINPSDIVGVGVTNQRGTTLIWNKHTGRPLYNAIGWSDTRTCGTVDSILGTIKYKNNLLMPVCGLTISSYFSAIKIKWLVENISEVKLEIEQNTCYFGTLDSWIIWNITGGVNGGVHGTDVTNASHTMLMNLTDLKWDKQLCSFFQIPLTILPTIKSCSEIFGFIDGGSLNGVPISGCIGDQQAALLGQTCLKSGQVICTYDEGCSLLVNTGQEIIYSDHGLLSTVAYQLGAKAKPCYALEGIIGSAGSAITWLKDILQVPIDINPYQNPQPSNVVFVPAFCGLCSPIWNHNVRGIIMGLTVRSTSHDITLAAYDAIGYQTFEIIKAVQKDCRTWLPIAKLIVGGDFSDNSILLQELADLCGVEIERPHTSHPSCLGAMLAAGVCMDVLCLENNKITPCCLYTPPFDSYSPIICSDQREIRYEKWKKAVKTYLATDDVEQHCDENHNSRANYQIQNSIPGGLFLVTSVAILAIAQFLNPNGRLC